MKNLFYTLMFFLGLVSCKNNDPVPAVEIASIVDTWKLTAFESTVEGKLVWTPVETETNSFRIRYDGVILDANGLPSCCAPKAYYVNGKLFEVKPKETVPSNPHCSLIDCIMCGIWYIEQSGDVLITTNCEPNATRFKYMRE